MTDPAPAPQQATAYYDDGSPIPEDKLAGALASGQASFDRGAEVHMVAPDGGTYVVPAQEVGQAMGKGFGIQSASAVQAEAQAERARAEKEARTTGLQGLIRQQQALRTGGFRGATFGLSDWAMKEAGGAIAGALGVEDADEKAAQYLKDVRDDNAALSTVGEVGGAVGAAFLPVPGAGAGIVGKGLGVLSAPGRLAGALGERAVVGAGLGAAKGLGGRLAAGAVRAGTAGAFEGALQGAGNEFSKAVLENRELTAEKLLAGAGWGSLMGAGLGAGLGAAGVGLGDAASALASRAAGDDALREALTKTAGERAYKALTGNYIRAAKEADRFGVDAARAGQKALDEGIPVTGKLDDAVEALSARVERAGDDIAAVARQVDDAGVRVDTETVAAKLREEAATLRNSSTSTEYANAAKNLEREASEILRRGDDADAFSWFHKNRGTIKELDNISGLKQQIGKTKYRIFSEGLEGALQKADPESGLSQAWSKATEDFKDFAHLRKMAEKLKDSRSTNRTFGLTDTIMGAAGTAPSIAAAVATGNPLALAGMAAGPALAAGNKFFREQGSGYLAKLADKLAKFDSLGDASVKALIDGTSKASAKTSTHIGGAVVSGSDLPGATKRGSKAPDVVKAVRAVAALSGNPDAMVERTAAATRGISETHPEVALAMGQQMTKAAQFLQSKLPTPLEGPNMLQQPLQSFTYTAQDLERFDRYLQAVDDPLSVVKSLGKGRIDWEGIEAVKAVYPELFSDLQSRVITMVAERTQRGEPLPYGRRIRLGLAFDIPADRTMRPEFVGAVQESWAADAQPPGPPPRSKSLPADIGKGTMTPAQRAIT